MTRATLLRELAALKGKQLIDVVDRITATANPLGYSVNILDPVFNTGSIDRSPQRLNVHTGENSIITSFSIG